MRGRFVLGLSVSNSKFAAAAEDGGAFRLAIHLCHVQSTLSVPIPCVIVDDMLLGQVLDSADAA